MLERKTTTHILVPTGRAPFDQNQESRPLARSNTGSPRFTDLPSLYACSESSLTNLIGSGLNLLRLQSRLKPECCWTWPEVAILGADQKERGLWDENAQHKDRNKLNKRLYRICASAKCARAVSMGLVIVRHFFRGGIEPKIRQLSILRMRACLYCVMGVPIPFLQSSFLIAQA